MDERTIFLSALEKDNPQERAEYLRQACGENQQLRRQVEGLLRASSDAGEFLESPPRALVATIASGAFDADAHPDHEASLEFLSPSEKPGCLGRLAQYEVVELVGRGGMGLVLRAFDPKLNRVVAIKVMAPELAASPMAVKRFLREAKAAAAVSHDHVVTIHSIHDRRRPPFLVMEFVDGKSLQQKIDACGALELREILRIGAQTASGLAAAHKQGLVHRDIKPANILLENGVERVKITDFGLARMADDVGVTQTGLIAGTPEYMSPEQAQGQPVDARSDLFSLGSVLYTMCTGRPPFRGDTAVAILRRVCDDEPRPIRTVNSEIPAWMEAIIARLLAKDPDDRFQSAEEVADLLSQYLAHVQHPATSPMPQPASLAPYFQASPQVQIVRGTARYLLAPGLISLVAAATTVFIPLGWADGGPALNWWFQASGLASLPVGILILFCAYLAERRDSYRWTLAGLVLSLAPVSIQLISLLPVTGLILLRLIRSRRQAALDLLPAGPPSKEPLPPLRSTFPGDYPTAAGDARWGWFVVAGLLAVVALLAALSIGVWYFAETDYGILVIESPVDTLEIERLRNGRVDRVYDTLHFGGTRWHVPAGEWDFRIKGGSGEYLLETTRIRFQRGTHATLKVIAASQASANDAPVEINTAERLFTGKQDTGLFAIAISPDGRRALSGHAGGGVTLWDLESATEVRHFQGHVDTVYAVLFGPDDHILTGGEDGTIRQWRIESGDEVRRFQGHTGRVERLVFSEDRSLLLSASADYKSGQDNSVRLWDVAAGGELRRIVGQSLYTRDLLFSPDAQHVYTGGLNSIVQCITKTGEPVHRFPPGPTDPDCLAISPDGRWIAAGYIAEAIQDGRWFDPENCRVVLWDLSTRTAVRELQGHTGPIEDLAFTPDGRRLLSVASGKHNASGAFVASSDRSIRLWDVDTGREIARYQPSETVRVLAVAPDGESFLSGGESLRRWRLPEF